MKKTGLALMAAALLAVGGTGTAIAQGHGGWSHGGGGWHGGGGGWHGGSGGWHGGSWHGGHWYGPGLVVGLGFPGYYWPGYYPYAYGAYPYVDGVYSVPLYTDPGPVTYNPGPVQYMEKDAPAAAQTDAAPASGEYSYYCTEPAGYYPQTPTCTKPWLKVVPNGSASPRAR